MTKEIRDMILNILKEDTDAANTYFLAIMSEKIAELYEQRTEDVAKTLGGAIVESDEPSGKGDVKAWAKNKAKSDMAAARAKRASAIDSAKSELASHQADSKKVNKKVLNHLFRKTKRAS